jgi:hypothetical protein
MQKPQDKYDEAMQDYARKWMRTLDKPRHSTNISIFFIAIFIFIWSSTLTNLLGYVPLEGLGIIIFFSIGAGFIISSIFINTILTKLGFEKPLRSALWFSALVGPYISIVAINNWDNPALSHITGVVTAILAFVLSYFLDRAFTRKSKSGVDDH